VPTARDAFETAARNRGWSIRRIRDTATVYNVGYKLSRAFVRASGSSSGM
jgi:hypothetical protein